MGHTPQNSISHNAQRIALDLTIRTQQAVARREMDDALRGPGRLWESTHRVDTYPLWMSGTADHKEEIFIVVDLTNDTLAGYKFTTHIFPYEKGDRCLTVDYEQAQAVIFLARIAATRRQLDVLNQTSTIVGYAFKVREEISHRFPALFAPNEDEGEKMYQRKCTKRGSGAPPL